MSTLKIKDVVIGEGASKIIVPLVGKTEAEMVKSLKPDVVEWRVDIYEKVEDLEAVTGLIAKLRKVFTDELLLFTFRSHKEGGNKEISDAFYVELNQTAIRTKNIDLVDVELFNEEENVNTLVATAKENGVYVIMSNHDFFKTPDKEEIISRLAGEVFGSAFTFGAGKEASAPGQIPVEELRTVLNILHKSL